MSDENPTGEFLPTRKSLLSRLKNWDDNDSWRDFFDTYWRLIYDVARKSGFNDAEAQDIVQETVISVAGQIAEFRYDATKGRFKNWLGLITRCRIADHLRKKYRDAARAPGERSDWQSHQDTLAALPDPKAAELDALWETEWHKRLLALAMERVKRKVRAEHFQIFELCAVQEWPVSKVSKALGVSLALIYVTRHRVGALLKKELRRVETETE